MKLAPSYDVIVIGGHSSMLAEKETSPTLGRASVRHGNHWTVQTGTLSMRLGGITVALQEYAIEQNAILHQIRHRHRGNAPRTASGKHSDGSKAPAGDH